MIVRKYRSTNNSDCCGQGGRRADAAETGANRMLRALRRAGPLQSACITPVRVHARCLATSERANPPWAMDKLVAFAKQRGFVFPSSEVYGAVGAGYDYGPLGVQLKKNIQDRWWRDFVTRRSDCVGLDSAIILNRRVWAASGHVEQFVDPLTECRSCRKRVRADKLVLSEGAARLAALDKKKDASPTPDAAAAEALAGRRQLFARCADAASVAAMSLSDMGAAIHDLGCRCPGCGAAGEAGLATPKMFNLLFQTHVGATVPAPAGASGATPQSAAAPAAEASTPTAAAAAVETAAVTGAGAASDAGSKQPKGGKKGSKGSAAASGASSAAAAASASSSAAALESADGVAYLRPETAQGVYVNFSNVANASRLRLPFGIGQTGKSFRNEVSHCACPAASIKSFRNGVLLCLLTLQQCCRMVCTMPLRLLGLLGLLWNLCYTHARVLLHPRRLHLLLSVARG